MSWIQIEQVIVWYLHGDVLYLQHTDLQRTLHELQSEIRTLSDQQVCTDADSSRKRVVLNSSETWANTTKLTQKSYPNASFPKTSAETVLTVLLFADVYFRCMLIVHHRTYQMSYFTQSRNCSKGEQLISNTDTPGGTRCCSSLFREVSFQPLPEHVQWKAIQCDLWA